MGQPRPWGCVLWSHPTSDSPSRAPTSEPLHMLLLCLECHCPTPLFVRPHPRGLTQPAPLLGSFPGTQAVSVLLGSQKALCFPPQTEPSNLMVHSLGVCISLSVTVGDSGLCGGNRLGCRDRSSFLALSLLPPSATCSQSLTFPLQELGMRRKEQGGPDIWNVSYPACTPFPPWPRPAAPHHSTL